MDSGACGRRTRRAERGEVLFGNMDTWLIWNLTGGPDGGVHVTDVTNASRTLFMNLETLDWDDDILQVLGIPRAMLPEIRSSSQVYGEIKTGPFARCAGGRRPGRPAGGALRADLFRTRVRPRTLTAPAASC